MANENSTGDSPPSDPAALRETKQRQWNWMWSNHQLQRPWFDRGISPEIVEAVRSGWLPSGGRVLDIGCGLGDVSVWFAAQGYDATGIDYAQAVRRAAQHHAQHLGKGLRFVALDITSDNPPDERYDILVDRGCLHTIPKILVSRYASNLASMASPGARMLLFIKAFRDGEPFGDESHMRQVANRIRKILGGAFRIEGYQPTHMNKHGVPDPHHPLPGMLFRLIRTEG